jgi:hypothetical protein
MKYLFIEKALARSSCILIHIARVPELYTGTSTADPDQRDLSPTQQDKLADEAAEPRTIRRGDRVTSSR